MIGTVPADITQYYVHAFRIMQKLAYLYGWQSFLNDLDDIDDETLAKLAMFLGVMMGVGGVGNSLGKFAAQVARPAIQKNIANAALTKTAWYVPMKQTLKLVGVSVTKQSFAKSVTKVVPLVGGVASGSLTYVTLHTQSVRLKRHLRTLPPPGVDAAEYLEALGAIETESTTGEQIRDVASRAGSVVHGAASSVADVFRSVDLDGDGVPDEARALSAAKSAGAAVKGAGVSMKGAAGAAASRFGSMMHRPRRRGETEGGDTTDIESASGELGV